METYDFFESVWTRNIDEPYKASFRPILEALANENCATITSSCVVPTEAWIAQGGTLDSCYESPTEPSYFRNFVNYLELQPTQNAHPHPTTATSDHLLAREQEILWPNSSTAPLGVYDHQGDNALSNVR